MNFSNIQKYFLNFCGAILVSLLIVFVYLIASAFESTNKLFSSQTINSIQIIPYIFISIYFYLNWVIKNKGMVI